MSIVDRPHLPGWYLDKLDKMDVPRLAIEAARNRSSKPRRQGICTELIFGYVRRRLDAEQLKDFQYLYSLLVPAIREAREHGRPQQRPIMHVGGSGYWSVKTADSKASASHFGNGGVSVETSPVVA